MDSEISEMYTKLSAQHKRYVNKLVRGLSDNSMSAAACKSVCRSINRHTPRENAPRVLSGYLKMYKTKYPSIKKKHPDLSLGEIGSKLGAYWRSLPEKEKERWRAR